MRDNRAPMNQDSLRAATVAAGIDAEPSWRDETPSTNDEAKALAAGGAPEWTVLAAAHQTAGRGRLGRAWVERPGTSLLFSMILRPELPPASAPLVTLLAAAAMARAANELTGVPVETKWPNDLVAGDRKLGGLLAEAKVEGSTLDHVVLGMGINLSARPEDLPPGVGATSLAMEGSAPEAASLLERFLAGFRALYRPTADGFPDEVLAAYRPTCATIGRRVRATTEGGREVEGSAVDVARDGGLVVESGGERVNVSFGEIVHLGGSGAAEGGIVLGHERLETPGEEG